MTAAESAVPSERRRLAVAIARKGYRIFPLKPDTKEPATLHGFKDASSEIEQVEAWWDEDPNYNIGLACGMQDNGIYVAVVDVDAKHGGVLAWKQLTRDNGSSWMRYMPIHKTPRQGFHIIGQVDPVLALNASNGFPRGIDTRGAGGYIVLPDSHFIDTETGEIGDYVCTTNHLWNTEPGTFPDWVIELWQAGPQRISIERHPSAQVDADSPLTWMKANIDWHRELERDKFKLHADFGGESRWTRDGKTRGTSLSLHEAGNGCVVVWSENCPLWMTNGSCGQPTADGHWSMNGFQYICARDFGGDVRAAMSAIRRDMMPPTPGAGSDRVPEAVLDDTPVGGLHLPPGFWLRPDLQHIFLAAQHARVSPEAMLVHVLARFSAGVHPLRTLPGEGSLDFMGVVLAASGGNKSLAAKYARKLYPGTGNPKVLYDQGVGSGEGLVEAFLVKVPSEDDPKRKVRQVGRDGIHFVVDESMGLLAQAGREGATIIPTLCTAWSGGGLGQRNADEARDRHIDPGQVRVAAVLSMQEGNAHKMYSENLRTTGFTGRMIFVTAYDENAPRERPPWPGVLKLPNWGDVPIYSGELTYPDEVEAEIDEERFLVTTRQYAPDERQSQRNHQRRKIAGLLALMDERTTVTLDDWNRANQVLAMSLATLDMLDALRKRALSEAHSTALSAKVADELYIEDRKQAHANARLATWALNKVSAAGPAGITYAALRKLARSGDRPALADAVDNLVAQGLLVLDDGVLRMP